MPDDEFEIIPIANESNCHSGIGNETDELETIEF